MREHEKAQVFNEAIEALTDEAVRSARPKNPDAYAATVRADLRERHRALARELFDEHGDITADEMVILLAGPVAAAPDPEPHGITPPELPVYRANDVPCPTPEERELARTRLAEIRRSLGGAA